MFGWGHHRLAAYYGGGVVMEPKPLTKERRAIITGYLKLMESLPCQPYYDFIADLLADSAYWQVCNAGGQRLLAAAVEDIKTYKAEQERLLKEVAYWRQVVRDAQELDLDEHGSSYCRWCGVGDTSVDQTINHKPDCPWMKTQEEG